MVPEILVAIDGSGPSIRAVDHVGEIVGNCKKARITLLHVVAVPPAFREHPGASDPDEERRLEEEMKEGKQRWMKETKEELEETLFGPARRRLEAKGASGEGVVVRSKMVADPHSDVASAILDEIKRGGYHVVVLGRRGKSTLKTFLMGTVVHRVVHNVEGCAVWVV